MVQIMVQNIVQSISYPLPRGIELNMDYFMGGGEGGGGREEKKREKRQTIST